MVVFRNSPPTTPQRQRNAAREQERQDRLLESPEIRRTPSRHHNGPPIPFLLGNNNVEHAQHPPFFQDDPFVDVDYNGQQQRLTPGIAEQVRRLAENPTTQTVSLPVSLLNYIFMIHIQIDDCIRWLAMLM